MYCSNCGSNIDDNTAFCPACGAALQKADADVGAQEGFPEPQQHAYPQQIPQPPVYSQQYPQTIPGADSYVAPPVVAKSNVLLGVLGAVVFSLIGCAVWVLIGSMGYISYLGALVMSLLTVTGYKLLGRKFDIPGVLVCIAVVALAVLASNVFINALTVANDAETMEILSYIGYDNFSDVFLRFFGLLNELDELLNEVMPGSGTLMSEFLGELALSYVFAGIAFVVVAVPQYKASKNR